MKDVDVVVVGAGIGGLAVAAAMVIGEYTLSFCERTPSRFRPRALFGASKIQHSTGQVVARALFALDFKRGVGELLGELKRSGLHIGLGCLCRGLMHGRFGIGKADSGLGKAIGREHDGA